MYEIKVLNATPNSDTMEIAISKGLNVINILLGLMKLKKSTLLIKV